MKNQKCALSVSACWAGKRVDALRPLLSTWAAVIIPVGGDVGTAHAIKLVNNLVSIGCAALWSECYGTLKKLDVAPDVLHELVRNSGMNCGNFENFSKYVCDGDPIGHKFLPELVDSAFKVYGDK